MASAPQQQVPAPNVLVEEKHFKIKLERSKDLLKTAIEDAIGVKLDELAYGMWGARVKLGVGSYKEITVRALPTDVGTTVEVRIEHGTSSIATGLYGAAILATVMLVFPLFILIAQAQEKQKRQARDRLIEMHKVWTEVSNAVGAPTKGGYRDRPERARVRVEEEEEAAEDAEAVEEEARAEANTKAD
jgi:hypothetical protein